MRSWPRPTRARMAAAALSLGRILTREPGRWVQDPALGVLVALLLVDNLDFIRTLSALY